MTGRFTIVDKTKLGGERRKLCMWCNRISGGSIELTVTKQKLSETEWRFFWFLFLQIFSEKNECINQGELDSKVFIYCI